MSIKRCTKPFAVAQKNGRYRFVRVGDLVEASDPVYKGNEAKFESVENAVQGRTATVEQATAAPGEKRSVSKPPKGGSGVTPPAKKAAASKKSDED